MRGEKVLVNFDVIRCDVEFAPVRHGIPGVYHQVHDDLIDLVWVYHDLS